MATVIEMMDWSSTVYYNRNRLLGCTAANSIQAIPSAVE